MVLTGSTVYVRRVSFGFLETFEARPMATKQDRGTKRTCQNCDERFYDLGRDPIICPFCGVKYVVASSPTTLSAPQAEQRGLAAKKTKKATISDDMNGELAAVDGEEALVDVETDESGGTDDDETFLEEEEEEGSDVSNIIGGPAGGGGEEL